MKRVGVWVADDGSRFDNEIKCVAYESLAKRVLEVMSTLPLKPEDDGCRFANGEGYIQHEAGSFYSARRELLDIIAEHIDHKWIAETRNSQYVHPSYVGRLVDDYGIMCLCKAWSRFSCTDKKLREWGQPYYANNEEGKMVQLNA